MLTLTGTLIHSFKSPQGETKEGKTYGGDYKIQILGQIDLPNGDSRLSIVYCSASLTADARPLAACRELKAGVFRVDLRTL